MPNETAKLYLPFSPRFCLRLFWSIGIAFCLIALGFHFFSDRFSYMFNVNEMPIISLVIGMLLTGSLFIVLRILLPVLVRFERVSAISFAGIRVSPLWAIFLIGFAARALLLFSEPVLEDDYHRYLWDGGVLAHGISPYKYSPSAILHDESTPMILKELSSWAAPVPERINHPDLRTIYPFGAELIFATSHVFGPWSITAWRLFILIAELSSFALLFAMVSFVGRSPLWLSLYWWNPLVIKELINSAHMEAVLMPFLLGGVYLAMRGYFARSSLILSLAASIKFWPALLLPLVWRPLFQRPLLLICSILISLLIGTLILLPFINSGLNETSGLVAYGMKWKTNSAFFSGFEALLIQFMNLFSTKSTIGALLARGIIGLSLIGLVFWFAFSKSQQHNSVLFKISVVCFALFFVSPAQFPWYFVWIAPFLVFYPLWGFVCLVPLLWLYYLGFYLFTIDYYQDYQFLIVLFIWLPVWAILAFELFHYRRRKVAPV